MSREQVIEKAIEDFCLERDEIRTTMLGGEWCIFHEGTWKFIGGSDGN